MKRQKGHRMKLTHGGDIYSYRSTHNGEQPLDFSANINPLGIPEPVKKALHEAVDFCDRYPDPLCRELRSAISQAEHIPAERIFCGNGTAEVLYRLGTVLHPRTALVTAPTFTEYERSLPGCRMKYHRLRPENDFNVTEAILDDITGDVDIVYLCSPNNPTGRTAAPELLGQIAGKCAMAGCRLVVDECFLDFVREPFSIRDLFPELQNMILLKAFTKIFAVPGVRLGCCLTSDTELIQNLYRAGQPWDVSVFAQHCGIAACACSGWILKTADFVAKERKYLQAGLSGCGLKVFPGEANYLLFQSSDTEFQEKLERRGILIRSCADYRGLEKGYYRTAVRTHPENMHLIETIRKMQEDGVFN